MKTQLILGSHRSFRRWLRNSPREGTYRNINTESEAQGFSPSDTIDVFVLYLHDYNVRIAAILLQRGFRFTDAPR